MIHDGIIMISKKQRTKEEEKVEFDRLYALLTSLSEKGKGSEGAVVNVQELLTNVQEPAQEPQNTLILQEQLPEHPMRRQLYLENPFMSDEEIERLLQRMDEQPLTDPVMGEQHVVDQSPIENIQDDNAFEDTEDNKLPRHLKHFQKDTILIDLQDDELKNTEIIFYRKVEGTAPTTSSKSIKQRCRACLRLCATRKSYLHHLDTSKACKTLLSIKDVPPAPEVHRPLQSMVDEWFSQSITSSDHPNTCKHCLTVFSSRSNLTKHYATAISCNRLALYEFKKLVASS